MRQKRGSADKTEVMRLWPLRRMRGGSQSASCFAAVHSDKLLLVFTAERAGIVTKDATKEEAEEGERKEEDEKKGKEELRVLSGGAQVVEKQGETGKELRVLRGGAQVAEKELEKL